MVGDILQDPQPFSIFGCYKTDTASYGEIVIDLMSVTNALYHFVANSVAQ